MAEVALVDQIKCAERELAMRRNVYPKLVITKRMNQEKADKEINGMEAIVATLRAKQEEELKQ